MNDTQNDPNTARDAEIARLTAEVEALRTERRRADDSLRQMARAVEQSPASIVITDRAGNIQYVNSYFEQATGYSRADALGQNPRILKSNLTPPKTYEELWRVITAGGEWRGEMCNRRKNGELYWEYAAISGMKDEAGNVTHYVAVKEEITQRKKAEQALEGALHEKEALLKETHHRVKNNLALISSLMRIEAGRSREAETKSVLKGMQARIQSVVLLNETLYKTSSYSRVKLDVYLREIATHVFQAHNESSGAVRLRLDLDRVEVETGQAIPCGLIVNELLTNGLKHAFPYRGSGEVSVTLRAAEGGLQLSIGDSGVGLPGDFEARRSQSLGLQLVIDLVKQLGGGLLVRSEGGASFTVTFTPHEPGKTGVTPDTGTLGRPALPHGTD